jgi:hypothetical protein
MHIDLLKAIPLDLRERLDEEFAFLLRLRAMEVHAMWPRCWKIITLYTNDELVIQSCKQYLSHHQCVISTLLFGLSLSPYYVNNGLIISKETSACYLNAGMKTLYLNGDNLELNWLLSRHRGLWLNICKDYLLHYNNGAFFADHLVDFSQYQLNDAVAIA